MVDFSPESLRAHFKKLTKARAAIDAKLDPLRAKLDKAGGRDMPAAAEARLRAEIVSYQRKLAPIEAERATVARALVGKTG